MSSHSAAVILAAGASERFGSVKQLAELDGRPMLQHVIDAVVAVRELDPVVLVLGAHQEEIHAAIDTRRAVVALCLGWEEGLAASLRAGVAAVAERDPDVARVVVVLGDTPRLETAVIEDVLAASVAAPPAVPVRATYDGRPGHPVVIPRHLLHAVEELTGDEGARELLAGGPMLLVAAGGPGGMDVDTPENLETLR
ncbi:NTP transferase domain-containing protein [Paraconexibacter sp.]|uniref:nucleotidyltransferase family protein n=1 Tax=Paraconexibacter sp. TaxID=2949640 RepID=UPI003567C7B7